MSLDSDPRFDELKATGKLPSPSGVALAIIELCRRDGPTIDEIAHAVRADPALSGRLIKFANARGGSDNITVPPMGHYGYAGYDGATLRTPRGAALKTSVVCSTCHDPHSSSRDNLISDGTALVAGTPLADHSNPANKTASNAICRKLGFSLQREVDFEFPPGHWMRCNDWRLDLFKDN